MSKVSEIMSSPPITIDILSSVEKAVLLMEKHGIGGLPVIDNKMLCGIITSKDVRRTHPNRIVADAMSRKVICVSGNTSLWHAIDLLNENKLERLPVIENEKLVGIITKRDILFEIGRHTDPLTSLNTGSYIRYVAENILEEGKELSVIFFDINDFGLLNKNHGHVFGDRCLQIIGRVLAENDFNGLYFTGRYGGDEFIAVTAENMEKAMNWANRVMQKIVDETREFGLPITISAGVSGGRRDSIRAESHFAATVDDLINKASLASTLSKKECCPVTFAK